MTTIEKIMEAQKNMIASEKKDSLFASEIKKRKEFNELLKAKKEEMKKEEETNE